MRLGGLLALALTTCSLASAQPAPPWHPWFKAAIRYASQRDGTIAFAVRTRTRYWHWHAGRTYQSASVIKAMLLVAYLDLPSVRHRALGPDDRALLAPMIRYSDNDAASRVDTIVGSDRLRALARRAGMRRFTPVDGWWGLSEIDAADQSRYFFRIDRLTVARHRAYALHLLRSIVPEQRWGIAQVRPHGWRLYFKGGWGSGRGLVDHQVALLTRGNERVSVAVLTADDDSHEYGKETLRGIAARLVHGLGSPDSNPR
jgi:Beta-lactamase enzyme family